MLTPARRVMAARPFGVILSVMTIVVAVDPGGRETGVVARSGRDLLAHRVIVRQTDGQLPDGEYLAGVVAYVRQIVTWAKSKDTAVDVAVETIVRPNAFHEGKRQNVSPMSLVGTAAVYGAVLAAYPTAHTVRPAKAGRRDPWTYPDEIRAPGKGGDSRRHVRSAWDIAGEIVALTAQLELLA